MRKRVLLVDDEPDILFGLKTQLLCWGVEIDTAQGQAEAKSLLQERVYDVVVSDLVTTDSAADDGIEFVRELRNCCPHTLVVVTTACGDAAIEQRIHEAGASFYFEKPVPGHVLRDALVSLGV